MEKFASISDQIIAWANKSKKEKDGHMLIRVIQLVFKKAMDEATWSEMYVQCCTGRKMIEQISTNIQDNGIKNNGKPVLNVFSAICWSFYFYLRIQVHTLPCLVCQSYMFSQALFYPHSCLLWSRGVFHMSPKAHGFQFNDSTFHLQVPHESQGSWPSIFDDSASSHGATAAY